MLSKIVDIVMCHKLVENETASIRNLLKQIVVCQLVVLHTNI